MAQTDNSYLSDKVALRVKHLPGGDQIRVLDCYAGDGKVWAAVQKLSGKKISRLPIDIRDDIGFSLIGDNLIYLESMNLNKFDIIDLDAYGVPVDQLEIIFRRKYSGAVFVTFIQSLYGQMPKSLLNKIGFTEAMIEKCPTIFNKRGWAYFKEYLALRGVDKIYHRSHARKHYIAFSCAAVS